MTDIPPPAADLTHNDINKMKVVQPKEELNTKNNNATGTDTYIVSSNWWSGYWFWKVKKTSKRSQEKLISEAKTVKINQRE